MKKNEIISIVLRTLIVILTIIGVFETALTSGFMSAASFLYFTIQSNITIALISLVFVIISIYEIITKRKVKKPRFLYILKFLFTVAITLTLLVFWIFLMPPMLQDSPSYLLSASNICLHTLVPIFAILDFILFDEKILKNQFIYKKFDFFYGCAMSLYYFFFAIIASYSGVTFGDNAIVPYFFLDYEANTWFEIGSGKMGVFWWFILILLIVIGISIGLIKLGTLKKQKIEL